jgi:hypothetical protein
MIAGVRAGQRREGWSSTAKVLVTRLGGSTCTNTGAGRKTPTRCSTPGPACRPARRAGNCGRPQGSARTAARTASAASQPRVRARTPGRCARSVGTSGCFASARPRSRGLRAVDPDVVLQRVATGRAVLHQRFHALTGQTLGCGVDLVGGLDLDSKVVHHGRLARLTFEQHQLVRGLDDREVRVAGAQFGRFGVEQLRVEVDRPCEIPNPEGELSVVACSGRGPRTPICPARPTAGRPSPPHADRYR